MSKEITVSLLGFDIVRAGFPATLTDLVGQIGEEAVYSRFLAHFTAHTDNGRVRKAIVERLEAETGFKRARKESGSTVTYDETEGQYIARLEKHLASEGSSLDEYSEYAQEAADSVAIDLTPPVRGGGSTSKPAAKWLAGVAQLLAEGRLEGAYEKLGVTLEPAPEDQEDEIGIDSLAEYSTESVFKVAAALRDFIRAAEKKARENALSI